MNFNISISIDKAEMFYWLHIHSREGFQLIIFQAIHCLLFGPYLRCMRVILKILTVPVVLPLTLFVWFCSAILYCSTFAFGLAGTLVGILALLVLFSGNLTNALILAVIVFLVSPVGIPMAAAWLLSKMQDLRYAIQSI